MYANDWNDGEMDQDEAVGFELREMLSMLDRMEGDLSDAAINEYGDELGLDFAL
jgi:hypothetical protein